MMENIKYNFKYNLYYVIAMLCIFANILAFADQLLLNDLPCPLCILQRFGFLAICCGALRTIQKKKDVGATIVIAAGILFTMFSSLRQLLLHIAAHDGGYGKALFNIHFYTWSAILAFTFAIFAILEPMIDCLDLRKMFKAKMLDSMYKLLYIILAILVVANMFAVFMECELTYCPDNPTSYMMLESSNNQIR